MILLRLLVMRSTSHLSGLNDICQVAYIGGSRPQIVLLSMWHKVACRLYKREKAGDQEQCLGDARSYFTLCRVFTFEDYFLGATGEKVYNPRQSITISITSHSRVVEFQEKTSVGNFIEGLWEVQKYGIYLLALIKVGCKVLYSENQLAFSRTFLSESML